MFFESVNFDSWYGLNGPVMFFSVMLLWPTYIQTIKQTNPLFQNWDSSRQSYNREIEDGGDDEKKNINLYGINLNLIPICIKYSKHCSKCLNNIGIKNIWTSLWCDLDHLYDKGVFLIQISKLCLLYLLYCILISNLNEIYSIHTLSSLYTIHDVHCPLRGVIDFLYFISEK